MMNLYERPQEPIEKRLTGLLALVFPKRMKSRDDRSTDAQVLFIMDHKEQANSAQL